MDNDYIFHHGIKGQKWGIRREKKHEERATKKKLISKINKQNKSLTKSMLTPGDSSTSYLYQRRKSKKAAKYIMNNKNLSVSQALSMAGKSNRREVTALVAGTLALSIASFAMPYYANRASIG